MHCASWPIGVLENFLSSRGWRWLNICRSSFDHVSVVEDSRTLILGVWSQKVESLSMKFCLVVILWVMLRGWL